MRRMLGIVVVLSALAGCGGSSYQPPGECDPPAGVTTTLVYPAPNATGVPDAFPLVVLGSSSPLPSSFGAFVVNDTTQNTALFTTVGVPPNPLPTPDAIPSFPNPAYQASASTVPAFVPGSTVTVYLNDSNSRCQPTLSLGTFRVQ